MENFPWHAWSGLIMNMDLRIIVVTHRRYWMPEDAVYLPLQAGRALHSPLGFAGDDTGENISWKNPWFCELTGMYWAWKNLSCSHVGLCHYRRYFANRRVFPVPGDKKSRIMRAEDYEELLSGCEIILPRKRRYCIETVRSHYRHAHNGRDLEKCGNVLKEIHPGYAGAFDRVMQRTSLYILNMFVMRRELFDGYCSWLFPVLFELEKRIDVSGYDPYEARVYGFLAERLFNVWLEKETARRVEVPVLCLEGVNWPVKAMNFLRRKFSRRRP